MSRIQDYFNLLGTTPDEIARSLLLQEVKGIIGSTYYCPILNGLNKKYNNYFNCLRIYRVSSFHYHITWDDIQVMDPELPQVIQEFIGRFDRGDYPDLEAKKVTIKTERVW